MIKILVFILISVFAAVESCRCPQQHPQYQTCNSDYVIKALVTQKLSTNNPNRVDFRIIKIHFFKANQQTKNIILNIKKISTHTSSSLCGANFDIGKTYLISGNIVQNRPYTNTCKYLSVWSDVPQYHRQGFQNQYQQGCSCNIENCFTPADCAASAPNNVCRLDYYKFPCYTDNTMCKPDNTGKCNWLNINNYPACL